MAGFRQAVAALSLALVPWAGPGQAGAVSPVSNANDLISSLGGATGRAAQVLLSGAWVQELAASNAAPASAVPVGDLRGLAAAGVRRHVLTPGRLELTYPVTVDAIGALTGPPPLATMACEGAVQDAVAVAGPPGATTVWACDAATGEAIRLEPAGSSFALPVPIAFGGGALSDDSRPYVLAFLDAGGRAAGLAFLRLDRSMLRTTVWSGPSSLGNALQVGDGHTLRVNGLLAVGSPEAPGVCLEVNGGTLSVDDLQLADDAVLRVNRGRLELGGAGSPVVLAGTFEVCDSWGSIYIGEDTTFSGSTLHLVSHIVISNGVTVHVTGSMILDGCVVEASAPSHSYAFSVEPGASFHMSRTVMRGCGRDDPAPVFRGLCLNNATAEVESCVFESNYVGTVVGPDALGVRLFHNVYRDNAAADVEDAGTDSVRSVDGWGSVYLSRPPPPSDPAPVPEPRNVLSLDLHGADQNGEIFVRPGATVDVDLAVSALAEPVAGCEAILGFSSTFFETNGVLAPAALWSNLLYEAWDTADAGARGKLDTAFGVTLAAPREGTLDDGVVGTVRLYARSEEGVTKVYFRPWLPDDDMAGTRLTVDTNGISGHVLTPFTANSGFVTVDGTPPQIEGLAGTQTWAGVDRDILDTGVRVMPGSVEISVLARDALSGLASNTPELEIQWQADPTVVLTPTNLIVETVEIGGETWSRFVWIVPVDDTASNGVYDVTCVAIDRAGNPSAVATGSFEVNLYRVSVEVECEGWNATQVASRDCVFTATDAAGLVLAVWTNAVSIAPLGTPDAGRGFVTLYDVPEDTAALSAKSAWHLRSRLEVTFGGAYEAEVSFTGADWLRGGDLTDDNQVTTSDYTRLRYHWYTAEPSTDISGDGQTSTRDYSILRTNWYTIGDPP